MTLTMQENPRGGAAIPMTDAEWQARVQLAACYRVFDLLGWTEMIFNHITLRLPGPQRVFLINPFGLMYHEVTASNLVAVDIDGHPVRPTEHAVNRAGFVTHSAIHGHVDQAHCVMHTHTTTGMAVACQEQGLSHDSFYGAQLHGRVAYHEFEGITVNPDERSRMLQEHRRQEMRDPAQPRPVELGPRHPRGLHVAVDAAARLRRAGGLTKRRRDACHHARGARAVRARGRPTGAGRVRRGVRRAVAQAGPGGRALRRLTDRQPARSRRLVWPVTLSFRLAVPQAPMAPGSGQSPPRPDRRRRS